jgi:transporter family protein
MEINMTFDTLIIALITFVSWGLGSFIAKLATNRIGEKSVFWDVIGYFPAVIIYSLVVFKGKSLFSADKIGIILAVLSGAVGSFGIIGFYILLTKKEVSSIVPLTTLYPALTVILAFIFLRESLTLAKITGIVLAMAAIYLLSL